jgi:hypothetical protein
MDWLKPRTGARKLSLVDTQENRGIIEWVDNLGQSDSISE